MVEHAPYIPKNVQKVSREDEIHFGRRFARFVERADDRLALQGAFRLFKRNFPERIVRVDVVEFGFQRTLALGFTDDGGVADNGRARREIQRISALSYCHKSAFPLV